MKRIGYVGLSTPSFYDYAHPASLAPSDESSSPNPIIEGAFGALLLYDELWFLCRSLCPENMRPLSCVKFLDEMKYVPEVDPAWLPDPEQIFDPSAITAFRTSSADYAAVKTQANVYWDAAADNHSHGLKIGSIRLSGNSWNIRNVVFDVLLVERLPHNVELITNSFSARLFKKEASTRHKLLLTEVLVLDSVPQFLGPRGPYHPCIEQVRGSTFLSDFRKWIQTDALVASSKEISEVKREVESKLNDAQKQIFLKYLEPRGSYISFAETMLGVGIDALIPGVATVKDLMGQLSEEKKKQGLRWQGFLLDARGKVANA